LAAAVSALLTACAGGGQTLVLFNDTGAQPQTELRVFTSLSALTAQNNVTGEMVHVVPARDIVDALRVARHLC
jgi:hypothetical protein